MISWLIEQSLICSSLIVLMLTARRLLNKHIGAINTYKLWLIIPIALMLPWLANYLPQNTSLTVFSYGSSSELQQLHAIGKSDTGTTLFIIWLVGMLAMGLYNIYQHNFALTRLQLEPIKPNRQQTELDHLNFYQSEHLAAPVITGLLKPIVILPRRFSQVYSPNQQQLILAHELNHLNSKDLHWNMVALFTLSLFWFNPIFWFAYRVFRQQQELACDQQVLASKSIEQKQDYARAMLIAATAPTQRVLTHLNYNEDIYMKERITQVNSHKTIASYKLLPSLVLLLTAATFGHSALAQNSKVSPEPSYRIAPKYPVSAARDGIEGYVVINFNVTADGSVVKPKVTKSVPTGLFDEAALNAIKHWRYKTNQRSYNNVDVQLNFVLSEGEKSAVQAKYKGTEIIAVEAK